MLPLYMRTGTFTSPNEIAPDQIALAMPDAYHTWEGGKQPGRQLSRADGFSRSGRGRARA